MDGSFSYWGETDRMIREGEVPYCDYCGEKMFPEDDHGRFSCFCEGYLKQESFIRRRSFPQVTEDMSDEEKEKIPPIYRLNLPPTKKEAEFIKEMLKATKDLNYEPKKMLPAMKKITSGVPEGEG